MAVTHGLLLLSATAIALLSTVATAQPPLLRGGRGGGPPLGGGGFGGRGGAAAFCPLPFGLNSTLTEQQRQQVCQIAINPNQTETQAEAALKSWAATQNASVQAGVTQLEANIAAIQQKVTTVAQATIANMTDANAQTVATDILGVVTNDGLTPAQKEQQIETNIESLTSDADKAALGQVLRQILRALNVGHHGFASGRGRFGGGEHGHHHQHGNGTWNGTFAGHGRFNGTWAPRFTSTTLAPGK